MPKAFAINGHILVDGKKMAKSEGNFITLTDGLNRFGTDALRFTLAGCGTGITDANFVIKNANDNIKKLETEKLWIFKYMEDNPNNDSNTNFSFWDLKFDHEMNKLLQQAEHEYEKMDYQKVIFYAFTEMIICRKSYFANTTPNPNLVYKYIRLFLSMMKPIVPKYVDQFGVNTNAWPCVEPIDPMMEFKIHLFNSALKIINYSIDRRLKKTQTPFTLQLTVYSRFNARQTEMIQAYPEQPKDPR
jgi:leucyl-tRNA synthetase